MATITLNKVSKRFADGTEAVREASFSIDDGEFFILVGPSGCGKSTLLNMIVGLEEISDGEILVDGKLINDLDPKSRNMAMVFQSYALYPHMSVRENMAFPLTMAKLPKDEIRKRVNEAAEILELGPLLDRKPRHLSGGQRQRVAMGRAIVRKPVAFLLDEPLSNLDARLRLQTRTELARLQKRLRTTTVYVTHDQTEAMTLGDRVAVLKDGVIQQTGTPRQLYEQPHNLFVAGFIGSPAMNFVPAKIDNHRLHIPSLNVSLPAPQWISLERLPETVIAGIRPECFKLVTADDSAGEQQAMLEVSVDVVEWLGADGLLYFQLEVDQWPQVPALARDIDKQPGERMDFAARLNATHSVREGDKIKLAFEIDKLYLFDADTGIELPRSG